MKNKLEELKLLSNTRMSSTKYNTTVSNSGIIKYCNNCSSKMTISSTNIIELNKCKITIIKFIVNEVNLINSNIFEIKLQSNNFQYNKETEGEPKKYLFLIVDDEAMIRSAMKRVIINEFKSLSYNIHLTIIEAIDGMECILAIYLARQMNLRIDAIISDETMPFISGSYCSKIILELISNGVIKDINMFISTSLTDSNLIEKYSKVVKKIFPKPINKSNVGDIIKNYCK